MNNYAEVILWGTPIGTLHLPEHGIIAEFEYDRKFVENAGRVGIEPSPIKMPLNNNIYRFPDIGESFKGVPGMIADSLPDKFGNAVINQWLAKQGKTEADFNVIDRLCYTGSRGMGALEYIPAAGPEMNLSDKVDVEKMVQFATEILSKRQDISLVGEDNLTYSQLLQLGTSAGGARAKAIIAWNEATKEIKSGQINAGDGFDYWLIKFDGVGGNGDHELEDKPEYTLIEYSYYQMAKKAGIEMSECRLFNENNRHHFMTKRFDRVDGKKVHMQTLGAMAHIDYNYPGLCSYEQAAIYMRQLKISQDRIEQFFRRMVFNVIAVNQDDHVKNISFLMDRTGKWDLSPAYDITFSYDMSNQWLKAHQMKINGKTDNITKEDLILAGRSMGVSKVRIDRIINEVISAVKEWPQIAGENGVRESTIDLIAKIINKTNW